MTFRKMILLIHLWLGFASGLVVLILGITGCLLVFETDIRKITEPQQFVVIENRAMIAPSLLKAEAEKFLDGKKVNAIEYPGAGRSAVASYYDADNYKLVALNPYSGKMLKVKNMNWDFFRVVLAGHYYLWLPHEIGQPIVASATLIFVAMLITGLFLWWPKNKAARKQRYKIKWNARWRRLNYDLHNVLGFYVSWVIIFIAITGLIFGFEWFAKSFYWLSSGGKSLVEEVHPRSDTTAVRSNAMTVSDQLWMKMSEVKGVKESIAIYYPASPAEPLEITINHRPGTYYNMDFYHFDQYSGRELEVKGVYSGKFTNATIPDKIKRMNYDIHVGAVLGFVGKLIAFFASLIAASLPVTGFYVWWGRRKKKIKSADLQVSANTKLASMPN